MSGPCTKRTAANRRVEQQSLLLLMPRDIATALGLNDHDVAMMLYGNDEPGTV
jgi:hypothetical protein